MSIKFPVRPEGYNTMKTLSEPQNAGQPETIPWVYFDTQTIATAQARQAFFAVPQNDPTLGNIEQGGTIPADTYFQIWSINFDFLVAASAQGAAGAAPIVNDLANLLFGGRGTVQLQIANKNYGPWPLSYCHASGGLRIDWQYPEAAAQTVLNFAQNQGPDGGYWTDGAIILPPNQSFVFTVSWNGLVLTTSRQVRMSMAGVKYRPVR